MTQDSQDLTQDSWISNPVTDIQNPDTEKLCSRASPEGPFGIRGVGEPPIVPGAAAIANAVRNAVSVRCENLPIRNQRLWKAMKKYNQDKEKLENSLTAEKN